MLYFRMFLVMGVSLYTSRVVLEQLGEVDYGIYGVVGGLIVMLMFINGAMTMSTVRFLSVALGRDDLEGATRVFRSAITIHIFLSLIILLLAETLGLWFLNQYMTIPPDRLSAANWVYQCSVASFVFTILRTPFSAVIMARERMEAFAIISVLEAAMKLLVALSLTCIIADKLEVYALLNLGTVVILTAATLIYCRHYFHECKSLRAIYDKDLIRPMTGFMSWSTIGTLSWVGKNQGCNILLNLFFGPVVNAAYTLSSQVNTALNGFVQNFTMAVRPQIFKTYAAGDTDSTESLIIFGSKISFYLLLIVSFPILIATEPILRIWLGTYPPYTPMFIKLVIVTSLVESFTYSIGAGVRATGRVRLYEITVGGLQLLSLPTAYLLLHCGMAPPSVLITIATFSCITLVARLWLLKNSIPQISMLRILRSVFLPSGLLATACVGLYAGYHYLEMTDNVNPLITIAGSLVIVLLLEAGIGLNGKERKIILQSVLKKFK